MAHAADSSVVAYNRNRGECAASCFETFGPIVLGKGAHARRMDARCTQELCLIGTVS